MGSVVKDVESAHQAFSAGDLPRAERLLKRVLAAAPRHSRAHELMAYVVAGQGAPDRAFSHLRRATAAPGASATAWYYLGTWLRKRGEGAEAIAALEKALAVDPLLFPALHDLGLSHLQALQPELALEYLQRAVSVEPYSVEAIHNMGCALHALGRWEEALTCYDKALALRSDFAPAWFNRSETLHDLRRYDEALAGYEMARTHGYEAADVDWNVSLTLLLLGDFRRGWEKYEARWQGPRAWTRRHSGLPAWNGEGEVRQGTRLLVWSEQGLGDTLQFCRYAPLLAAKGARVVLEVQSPLQALLSRLPGCEVVAQGTDCGPCDAQVPLLSLPRAFATELDSVPAAVPYLTALPERASDWRRRLSRDDGKLRVAIACSGRGTQKDNAYRSVPLEQFAGLQETATLFVVQVEMLERDRRYLEEHGGMQSLEGDIRDFEDTAAILAGMDLVITVDSSLAHLAGAMGLPVWILLPWTPTWRWLRDREDSPWYPTARLFRQASRGDWGEVMARVDAALKAR